MFERFCRCALLYFSQHQTTIQWANAFLANEPPDSVSVSTVSLYAMHGNGCAFCYGYDAKSFGNQQKYNSIGVFVWQNIEIITIANDISVVECVCLLFCFILFVFSSFFLTGACELNAQWQWWMLNAMLCHA